MTKTQKITLGVGGLILAGIIGYIIYRKQWKEFVNIGDSRWLPTKYTDKQLSLEMANKRHGIKAGDTIEIEHDSNQVPDGKAQVLEVVEKDGLPFVITSLKIGANPRLAGRVKITS